MKPVRVILLLVVLLLAAFLSERPVAATSAQEAPAFKFPLWKDVPGRPFAVLAHRSQGKAEWAAFASHVGRSARGRRRPCITVAVFTQEGRYANAGSCGPLAPEEGEQHPPIHPLIGETTGSYFAISFMRQVHRVVIELGSGVHITRQTKLLTARQARKARVVRFSYLAQSLPSDACIERIKGFATDGDLILDAGTDEC